MREINEFEETAAIEAMQDRYWEPEGIDINHMPTIPMCDCRDANEAYFGAENIRTRKDYPMVPTDIDDDSLCEHCGHYTYLGNQAHVDTTVQNFQRGLARRPKAKAVS